MNRTRAAARWLVPAAAAGILGATFVPTPSLAATLPTVAAQQATLVVRTRHVVRRGPDSVGNLAYINPTRPITRVRTVVPLLGTKLDASGRTWHRVRVPGRALGERVPPRSGWILAAGTGRSSTPLHLLVDRNARRVLVYRNGRMVRRFRAIIGAPSTPTPAGSFFVEEAVRMPSGAAGAPYALASSARSSVLYEFAGGPGQIALHGVANVGGTLGTAVSHGCVRLSGEAITWLATRVDAGVPITIV